MAERFAAGPPEALAVAVLRAPVEGRAADTPVLRGETDVEGRGVTPAGPMAFVPIDGAALVGRGDGVTVDLAAGRGAADLGRLKALRRFQSEPELRIPPNPRRA